MVSGYSRIPILLMFAAIAMCACTAEGFSSEGRSIDSTYTHRGIGALEDENAEIAFDRQGVNSGLIGQLKARIEDRTFKKIDSILVVRQGKVLYEAYFNGRGPDTLHDIRSAGKSITSALVGIAVDQGLVGSVDDKLFSYFPGVECQDGLEPGKEAITLAHVLSMSFGLSEPGAFPAWESRNWYKSNWIREVLCQPMEFEPGRRFDYDSAAPALFGPIIERQSGLSVAQFAEQRLFRPLKIERYRWHRLPDGRAYTGGGFRMRTRDMAKFGQLYLQNGVWHGQQVVSKEWVEKSTQAYLVANAQLNVHYGFYWWRETFPVENRWIETFLASGNGGNKIYVFPSEELVVAITASAYDQLYCHAQVRVMMNKYILPAVFQKGDTHPAKPVLRTVPQAEFFISVFVFLVTLVLCVFWPSSFSGSAFAGQAMSDENKGNRTQHLLTRFWFGINALVGIFYIGIVLGEAQALDLVLNCGYAQPISCAVRKVIISWAIIILTAGSLALAMNSWRAGLWSNMASACFSIFALVSLYGALCLGYLDLLFYTC